MEGKFKSVGVTVAAIVGIGLSTCGIAALAQDDHPKAFGNGDLYKPMQRDMGDTVDGIQDALDPSSMKYPECPSGMLHAYHYSDYTHWDTGFGSPTEKRQVIATRIDYAIQDEVRMDNRILGWDDRRDAVNYPMAMDYPQASSGTRHLYLYKDYTTWDPAFGNTNDAIARIERRRDFQIQDEIAADDKILGIDEYKNHEWYPRAETYPYANSGTLALYHFTDYTGWNERPGNLDDKLARMDYDQTQKTLDEIHRDNRILGVVPRHGFNNW